MAYSVSLEVFEGPLDLLLHLIQRAQIDIYDIPIAEITDQYMQYISEMVELNLDQASEFLNLAATLMRIKVRLLLPKPVSEDEALDVEADPRTELVEALLEYRTYKEAASGLEQKELTMLASYARGTRLSRQVVYTGVIALSLSDLLGAIADMGHTELPDAIAEVRLEPYNIRMAYRQILRTLKRSKLGRIGFSDLFSKSAVKSKIVALFLAILELSHRRRIRVSQEHTFSDICIAEKDDREALETVAGS